MLIDEARHGRADLTGERTTPRLGLSGARHAGVPGAGLLEKLIRKTALGSFRPIERKLDTWRSKRHTAGMDCPRRFLAYSLVSADTLNGMRTRAGCSVVSGGAIH